VATKTPDTGAAAVGEGATPAAPAAPAAQARSRSGPARPLVLAAYGLVAVVVFQLLLASVFLGVLHRPALHNAPVAVVGTSPLSAAVSRHGGDAIRLVPEPTAQAAQAAIRGGQVFAAILPGRHGESLVIDTAASPGTASVLTKGFTTAAAAVKLPLQVRDLAPLPASDPAGISAFFLVIAWVLGGYVGVTVLGVVFGGVRIPSWHQLGIRLALLAAYAIVSGLLGALLFGPVMGVAPGYNVALAGLGMLVVFGAATATAGLQALLGMPGTLLAIIAMVVFGDPTSGQSIATTLLASPWNVIGQGLPPGAGLSAARGMIYLDGANVAGPLTVLATWAAAGVLLMLAGAALRQRHHAVPAVPAGPAAQARPA